MIIVAQPKSASSSLYHSLGQILQWPACQDYIRLDPSVWCAATNPPEFPHMACLHSDAVELTQDRVDKWCAPGYIFKQHVVPSDHNLALFEKHAVVFLSRKPKDSTTGYQRSSGVNHLKSNNKYFKGVLEEMHLFRSKWLAWGRQRGRKFLELTYDQVVVHQRAAAQAVCDFWGTGVKVPDSFVLCKKRYTRDRLARQSAKRRRRR